MTSRVMLAFVLMVTAMQSHAQLDDEYRWETGAGIGLTGYLGDFNGNITRDFRPAATLQLRRVINPSMDVRLAATMGGIKGNSDNTATIFPDYAAHPYHFSHKLMDVGLAYEYNLWPYGTGHDYRGAKPLTPYLLAGVGITYVDADEKSVLTPNIPLGLGIKYKVAPRLNLGFEWAVHLTMSDKLDGVKDPYHVKSQGVFKNTDAYSVIQLTLTYSFAPKCANCNKDF
ncbi:type IX secretion system protein PorG [Prevotella sp.]|uniref:type IX secretion system protein PorG n=1 Tax=Prevotella sp. TaxID=59823 RepID=UPI002F9387B2